MDVYKYLMGINVHTHNEHSHLGKELSHCMKANYNYYYYDYDYFSVLINTLLDNYLYYYYGAQCDDQVFATIVEQDVRNSNVSESYFSLN